MNAKEAAATSNANAEKHRLEAEARSKTAKKNAAIKAKADLEAFIKTLTERCESSIEYATEKGKRECEASIIYGCDSPVQAKNCYETHPYRKPIDTIEANLKKQGYKISVEMGSVGHTSYNEESYGPDSHWTTYGMNFKISW